MASKENEDEAIRQVALQNAQAIVVARRRAEVELAQAKLALESKAQELAHSLAMMRATLESTTDGILVTDRDRNVTGYNEKFARMWRLPSDLMQRGDHRDVVDVVGRSLVDVEGFRARIDDIYASSPEESYDLLQLADGRVLERFSRIQFVDRQNVGRVWSFRDITERKQDEARLRQSEQRLTDFFENAALGLHWAGPDGTILRVNQAELDLLGYTREEYLGRNIAEFHVDEPVIAEILQKLLAGESLREREARLRCKDGSIKHVLIDSNALWQDGRLIHTRCFTRDITAQKRVEQALRESESQLRMVMDHAPVYIARCDRDFRFQFVNRRYAERFGVQSHEVVGRPIPEVLGEEVFAALRPYIETVLSGKPVDFEIELIYPRIGRRHVRCAYEPERDSAGQVQGWIAVISDITEHQRGAEARSLLGAIVESSQDAIVSKSLDGRILSWNAAAEHLFGYSAREAIGESISIVIPPDRQDEERVIVERLQRGERIEHFETVRVAKGGRRFDASVTISPVRDAAGRIVGASKIARDISALKRTERSNRFLAEASAVLAELSDDEGALRRIAELAVRTVADWCAVDLLAPDRSVCRTTLTHRDPGMAPLVQAVERTRLMSSADGGGPRTVLRTGKSEWAETISDDLLSANVDDPASPGGVQDLVLRSYLCVPLKARGAVLGALTFITADSHRTYDVQDLRMAEELAHRAAIAIENANLLAALRETDVRKDEFLATLAHELRNPLAPISNALAVMRMSEGLQGISVELREIMEGQVNQLVRLVDDLMEVSRISRGKIDLRKEMVELSSIVKSAIEISRALIDEGEHRLEVNLPPEAIVLNGDEVRLTQVLANLLTNAAKYMEPGGLIELDVTLDGPEVVVSVRDSGLGIPRKLLPRVFEMFVQMEHTRNRAQGGLGIGLALAKSLIEMHGGRIEVHSEGLGKGSQFIVRLPLADAGLAARGLQSATLARSSLPRRSILVVDDTRAALFVLDKLLTAMGQQVRTVQDATAAIEAVRNDPPDIVISDIGMPNIDGYQLARELRQQAGLKDVVLVALTGYGQVSDRQRAKEAGFDHHLVKPVDIDHLRNLLLTLGAVESQSPDTVNE